MMTRRGGRGVADGASGGFRTTSSSVRSTTTTTTTTHTKKSGEIGCCSVADAGAKATELVGSI